MLQRLRSDVGLALLLLLLALALRVPALGYPDSVVFDETHIGKYVSGYFTGQYVFDVHPPLSRSLLALMAGAAGFRPGFGFAFEAAYPASVPVVALRLLPALLGSLLIPLLYLLARELRMSKRAALLVGLFALLDTMLVVFSRFMLLDSFLLFFSTSSLWLYFRSRRGALRASARAPSPRSGMHRVAFALAGVAAGLALATKWTAAATLAFLVLFELLWAGRPRAHLRRAGALLGIAAVVYLSVFALQLPWLPGSSEPVQRIVQQNLDMLGGNWRIPPGNAYASAFTSWPLMLRPVYGWTDNAGARIYVFGNPAVWWLCFAGIVLALSALSPLTKPWRPGRKKLLLALLGLWALSYLPYAFVQREVYVHAYLPALLASMLVFGMLVDRHLLPSRNGTVLFACIVIAVAAAFLFFAPFAYGTHLSAAELAARQWLPGWA